MPNEKSKESSLWKWLKQAESAFGPDLHMERIENSAGFGTPDVHGCSHGTHFTIELKSVARKRLMRAGVSPEQEWWALRRSAVRGNHWLLIQIGSGSTAVRYLVPGRYVRLLMEQISEQSIAGFSHLAKTAKDAILIATRR